MMERKGDNCQRNWTTGTAVLMIPWALGSRVRIRVYIQTHNYHKFSSIYEAFDMATPSRPFTSGLIIQLL